MHDTQNTTPHRKFEDKVVSEQLQSDVNSKWVIFFGWCDWFPNLFQNRIVRMEQNMNKSNDKDDHDKNTQ